MRGGAHAIDSVTYAEALEVALCYGWIDGRGRSLGPYPRPCSALGTSLRAAEFFAAPSSREPVAVLRRIQGAKKPKTRARRIEQFVEMLGRGEKLYP